MLILLDAPPSEKVRIQVKVNVKVIAYWGTRQQRQGHIGNIVKSFKIISLLYLGIRFNDHNVENIDCFKCLFNRLTDPVRKYKTNK